MPRPGPRPYECVRRAWHSDRHQPIRGSLIQEIFRIVNEIHSSATKKNKEWQEKLPIVVLKAEEIMYSKANSEAEYVDVNTLRSRVSDAINTIIRRDESTETGELLQPCIEAALHLGCPARRASRSQRNNTPRFYLTPEKYEILSIPQRNVQANYATNCSFLPPSSSNFLATNKVSSSSTCINDSPAATREKISDQLKFHFSPNTFSPGVIHQYIPSNVRNPSIPSSVYPLYYGNQFQLEDTKSRTPCKSNSNLNEADRKSLMKKLTFSEADVQDVLSQADNQCVSETPPGNGCDLSLRLGPLVVPCTITERSWPQEVEDGGLGTSKMGTKSSDLSSQTDKGFSFFPKANAHDMFEFSSTRQSYMAQNLSAEVPLRKRKVSVSHPSEDRQFSWSLKLPFKPFKH